MLVSIAIPVYEMKGFGIKFLNINFNHILKQKFNFNLEVIISDQSLDEEIKKFVESKKEEFQNHSIHLKYYFDSNRGNHSANTNNAIRKSEGDIIKILYQDDFFYDENSLHKTVVTLLNSNNQWLVSACEHSQDGINFINPFYPKWNDNMIFGNNTYSSPSVVCLKRNTIIELFDENLYYMPDCEYYFRMRYKYGDPFYLNEITVVNMLHPNQGQNLLSEKYSSDIEWIKKKYSIR